MSFEVAFAKTVIEHEGGYSDHSADRGGETFCGISRKYHPQWEGWSLLDSYNLEARKKLKLKDDIELAEQVTDFYFDQFWKPMQLDMITSVKVRIEMFDSAVNVGKVRASKWLQESVNLISGAGLVVDGAIGRVTISAVLSVLSSGEEKLLLKVLNGLQFEHYHHLVLNDPSQKTFFKGWILQRVL